jgi:hypothetical protein
MQYNEGDERWRKSRKKQTKVWRDLGGTRDMFDEVGVGFLTLIPSPMYSFPGKNPGTR